MRKLLIPLAVALFGCSQNPKLAFDNYPEKASLEVDEAPHERNSLEWWYFTGWLNDVTTHDTFGVEFVMFNFNMNGKKDRVLTNMAITDVSNQSFYYSHALNAKDSIISAKLPLSITAENHQTKAVLSGSFGKYLLQGSSVSESMPFEIQLETEASKPVLMHGDGSGFENYGDIAKAGYYSFPKLSTNGKLTIGDEEHIVEGDLWYDRQWNCGAVLSQPKAGWDWMSITINETGEQLMLYRLRVENEQEILGGTLLYPNGSSRHLSQDEILIVNKGYWKSNQSKNSYPTELAVEIPSEDLKLTVSAVLNHQELGIKILPGLEMHYWEGMCHVRGTHDGNEVTGTSYLEITNPQNRK